MALIHKSDFAGTTGTIVPIVGSDGNTRQDILLAVSLADPVTGLQSGTTANPVNTVGNGTKYKTVAASQTATVLGATGATGDLLSGLLIIPATTTPGLVTILDNATSIPVFVGGTTTVQPFFIPLGIKSVSGAWKVTTGASVSVIAVGNFT